MRAFVPATSPRRAIFTLLLFGGLVIASWVVYYRAAHPAAALVENYAAGIAQRRGESTVQLIARLQERLRSRPDDWQAASQLGTAYLQRARETGDPTYYRQAEGVLQQALEQQPEDYAALSTMGALELARHQFRSALEWGERARKINPYKTYAIGVIADAQIELGMYDEAVQTIQTMVDMRPDLNSYSRVSYARELHGDLEGAIEAMQAAVSAGAPGAENTEWTRVQLGNLYFTKGDLASAEHHYRESLLQLPDYVHALGGLARVRAAQGRYGEASDLYNQAIARIPLPEFVIALGEMHEAAGRTAEAAQQYNLVHAMQRLFRENGVDTDLELALFDADHGQDPPAAVARARAAYDRRPSIKAADTLAWVLFRAGQVAEARHYADQALRLGTQDPLLLYHAGMIARAQGDMAAARAYLERSLALNPHFSPLHAPRAQQALTGFGAR